MSNPNRYHLWAALECHAFSKAEAVLRFSAEEDGMWVQWQDYASLKAEVERLRASSFVTAVPVEQYERLRKAGDAMVSHIRKGEEVLFECLDSDEVINDWNAAKEGKPSV